MIRSYVIKAMPLIFTVGIFLSLVRCGLKDDEILDSHLPLDDIEIIRGSVEDIDGNVYETVFIGGQEWMASNLKTTRYRDGSAIEHIGDNNEAWAVNSTGAYSWYQNLEDNKEFFGAVYNWHATVNPAGLCPAGWRVPSAQDWLQMEEYLIAEYRLPNSAGMIGALGNRLKSCRQQNSPLGIGCLTSVNPRWSSHPEHFGFNDFGFSALPIGSRISDGTYYFNPGWWGQWWSRTSVDDLNARHRYITYDNGQFFAGTAMKTNGYAVRCVR